MSELDQGAFSLGLPDGIWRKIPVIVAVSIMVFAAIGISSIDSIFPKMPRVSDVPNDIHPLDVTSEMAVNLVPADDDSQQVVWVVADSIILNSEYMGYSSCTQTDDGESHSYALYDGRYSVSYQGRDFDITIQDAALRTSQACGDWTYGSDGVSEISAYFMIEISEDGEIREILLEGGGDSDERPARKTASEGAAITLAVIISISSFLTIMFLAPPLRGKLRKMRQEHSPQPRIHADANGVRFAQTHEWNGDDYDWVLDPSPPENWDLTNPYAKDLDGEVIPEHPVKIGTPKAATFTLYSVFGIIFVLITSFWIGNYIDKEMDGFANLVYQPIIFLISSGWAAFSFRKSRKIRAALDTPTSLVRSVAAGMAEVVGQVRPAREGTQELYLGGNYGSQKLFDGVVAYRWEREIWETRKTGKDSSTTKWWHEASGAESRRFIVHDGSGGLLVDGDTFKIDLGKHLAQWQTKSKLSVNIMRGNKPRRFTVHALRAGDPVYVYGKAFPRPREEVQAEGLDGSLANTNLVMRGESDSPSSPVCHRGTELAVLCNARSTIETILVPCLATFVAFVMIFI